MPQNKVTYHAESKPNGAFFGWYKLSGGYDGPPVSLFLVPDAMSTLGAEIVAWAEAGEPPAPLTHHVVLVATRTSSYAYIPPGASVVVDSNCGDGPG